MEQDQAGRGGGDQPAHWLDVRHPVTLLTSQLGRDLHTSSLLGDAGPEPHHALRRDGQAGRGLAGLGLPHQAEVGPVSQVGGRQGELPALGPATAWSNPPDDQSPATDKPGPALGPNTDRHLTTHTTSTEGEHLRHHHRQRGAPEGGQVGGGGLHHLGPARHRSAGSHTLRLDPPGQQRSAESPPGPGERSS